MVDAGLAKTIDDAFEARNDVGPSTKGPVRDAVDAALDLLDRGEARVAEKQPDNSWHVNQWLKKAVLLSFRLNDMAVIDGGPGKAVWTRCRRSSTAGATTSSAPPASAPCRAAWCAARPTSRKTSC